MTPAYDTDRGSRSLGRMASLFDRLNADDTRPLPRFARSMTCVGQPAGLKLC